MLKDAEHLLNYAVEAGIEVEADIAKRIIAATSVGDTVWDGSDAGELAAAITKLAAKLKPVTAETLRACREDAHEAISTFKKIALRLAAVIVPLSILSFISVGISNKIAADITTANEQLLMLHQLDALKSSSNENPSPLVLSELQKFAAEMREIYSRTRQIKWLWPFTQDPCGKLLAPSLVNREQCTLELDQKSLQQNVWKVFDEISSSYQLIRSYANDVKDDISLLWGAIGTCVLPVLYALLGACAAVLRNFTQQFKERTFAPTYATPARFYIAAIGGGVVGLFNNVFGQNLSIPPLALAFLVGYATDIFFSFLEGSAQNLSKVKPD